MRMTLFRTKDGRYLRSASREGAPEGSGVVEVSKLRLADLRAAITALSGQPCGKLKDKSWGGKRLLALLVTVQGEPQAEEKGDRYRGALAPLAAGFRAVGAGGELEEKRPAEPQKTASARRVIPLSERAGEILEGRRKDAVAEWIFPAPTRSGHIEKSSLRKQHLKACARAGIKRFPLYTLRHTCLTRWARTMDPYILAYLAGHSDFATTRRYVHPHAATIREALARINTPPEPR